MRRWLLVAALAAIPILLLFGFLARDQVRGEDAAVRRADMAVFQHMLQESAGDLHPSDALRIAGRETPPCRGDSGSGPSVVRCYDWAGESEELFTFYQAELEQLGWQSLERELQPNVRGDFEILSGTKSVDGYPLRIEVRTVKDGRRTST